jgi:hypothetical protein
MNCKKVVQLIPLFVGEDLETAEMQCVTAHLATCNLCSDAVKKFQASQSMLHSFAAPEFDEAVFAQMRSSVLNEIARPQIENFSTSFWNRKTAFAASLAMIILVSGIAMNRHNSNENYVAQSDNFKNLKSENSIASPSPNLKIAATNSSSLHRVPKPRSGRNLIAQGEASVSQRNPGNVNENPPSPEGATEITTEKNTVALNSSIPVIPETNTILNTEKSFPEPEMLRMEIQTADPNIKIIWLMPQTNAQADRK